MFTVEELKSQLPVEERKALLELLAESLSEELVIPAPVVEEPFEDPRNEFVALIIPALQDVRDRVDQTLRLAETTVAATNARDREIEHNALMVAYAAIYESFKGVQANTGKDKAEISAWYLKQAMASAMRQNREG
jgi:hypothetical protein